MSFRADPMSTALLVPMGDVELRLLLGWVLVGAPTCTHALMNPPALKSSSQKSAGTETA